MEWRQDDETARPGEAPPGDGDQREPCTGGSPGGYAKGNRNRKPGVLTEGEEAAGGENICAF
ncbi:hypothetical protein BGZ63DRAFT_375375 [Mariannaea sp. PMI_226]|nr:hypothetical protein BGZ63DRAFT_375375 [Mariannaea sp. PMI_226]